MLMVQNAGTGETQIAAFNTDFADHSQDPGGPLFAKRCHSESSLSSSVVFSNMSSGGLPG
jgi:hypothetical protein